MIVPSFIGWWLELWLLEASYDNSLFFLEGEQCLETYYFLVPSFLGRRMVAGALDFQKLLFCWVAWLTTCSVFLRALFGDSVSVILFSITNMELVSLYAWMLFVFCYLSEVIFISFIFDIDKVVLCDYLCVDALNAIYSFLLMHLEKWLAFSCWTFYDYDEGPLSFIHFLV